MAAKTVTEAKLAPLVKELGLYSPADNRVLAALLGSQPLDAPVTYVRDARTGDLWIVLEPLVRRGRYSDEVPAIVRFPLKPGAPDVLERFKRPENQFVPLGGTAPRISTERLAAWLVSRTKGVGNASQLAHPTYAPSSGFSRHAYQPLAGDLGECMGFSGDVDAPEVAYSWYDLREVRLNGLVWRLSGEGTLWVFIRALMSWEVFCYPKATWPHTADGRNWRTLLEAAGIVPALKARVS